MKLTLNEYQTLSRETAHYAKDSALAYTILGLAGEAGEVANEYKRTLSKDGGVLTDERRARIKDELSDVLWYVAATAFEIGENLSSIAEYNLDKLRKRHNG